MAQLNASEFLVLFPHFRGFIHILHKYLTFNHFKFEFSEALKDYKKVSYRTVVRQ